jgi:uracil-DNA glycosylase
VTELTGCRSCRRLTRHLDRIRLEHPSWHNAPVPAVGPEDAPLLILGLAPGRKGANRTGIPFVGDRSSLWLQARLQESGCVDNNGKLIHIRISNAVKCLPPGNKPTTQEIKRCVAKWLVPELVHPSVVLALGTIAHNSVLRAVGEPLSRHPFAHGATHILPTITMIDCFHPSPLNTQTGRMTTSQFNAVLSRALEMTQLND